MTRYVVMTVELWERLTIDAPLLPVPQFNVSHERLPGCGYLPVFDTFEEAKREYPGKQVLPVKPVEATAS